MACSYTYASSQVPDEQFEVLLSTSDRLNNSSIIQTCYIQVIVKEPSTFGVVHYFKPKSRQF